MHPKCKESRWEEFLAGQLTTSWSVVVFALDRHDVGITEISPLQDKSQQANGFNCYFVHFARKLLGGRLLSSITVLLV